LIKELFAYMEDVFFEKYLKNEDMTEIIFENNYFSLPSIISLTVSFFLISVNGSELVETGNLLNSCLIFFEFIN